MTPIKYITGDATYPIGDGLKIIAHVCNDIGGWGRGFVLALSARWDEPEQSYRRWAKSGEHGGFGLGETMFVGVGSEIMVANMVAQHGTAPLPDGTPPIRYSALRFCLSDVAKTAKLTQRSVHMPRIGCGLAGGKWEIVEPIIVETLCAQDVPVYVYDLPSESASPSEPDSQGS